MDIDRCEFKAKLPSILNAISGSRFVSIDVELSGIPRKHISKSAGKQSLQERYSETKAAAEKYQVLQLGLTCAEEDVERATYVLRPFNFYLNPLVDRRLRIDRDFTYQSDAVDFLLGHGFQMEAPFLNGIPYLSWEEESLARAAAVDKNELPDIGISIDDTESLQLLRRARYEIDLWDWQAQGDGAFLNIGPIGYGDPKRNERGFNGYQKRLVHQLVRAEYPHLVSISRPDFIQLLPYDKIREDAQLARKRQGVERTIAEQSGLRLVVESLCSNFKTGVLDEPTLPTDVKDERSGQGVQSPQEHVATTAITSTPSQQKKPMLVGHNLFLDLIFIYECFFGTLPDRVEQFQANLASIFSMIVDTKYLADIINENSPRYKSSLEEIDEELSKIASPVIEIPEDFSKYAGSPRLHEAGFDSFLTARVFIRLSSKIGGQERQVHSAETDTDTNGTIPKEAQSLEKTGDFGIDSSLKSEHLSFSNDPDMIQFYNHFRNLKVEEPASERNLVMPLPNSEFWATFGNRLRVNGTLEDVCRIGRPFDRPMSTSYPSTGQIPGGWVP